MGRKSENTEHLWGDPGLIRPLMSCVCVGWQMDFFSPKLTRKRAIYRTWGYVSSL